MASKEAQRNISDKIKVLRDEGTPQKQAVAMSISMQKAGRLRPGGKYIRKGGRDGGSRSGQKR